MPEDVVSGPGLGPGPWPGARPGPREGSGPGARPGPPVEGGRQNHLYGGQAVLEGVLALGQAMSIGVRALTISANQATPEEERLSSRQMALSMTVAIVFFIGLFIVGPAVLFRFAQHRVHSSIAVNALEGVFR